MFILLINKINFFLFKFFIKYVFVGFKNLMNMFIKIIFKIKVNLTLLCLIFFPLDCLNDLIIHFTW